MDGWYIGKRLIYSGIAFFISLSITFFILHLMPGDYITNYLYSLGNVFPKETVEQFYHQFGLDLPVHEQYIRYLGSILAGQWGYSYEYSVPVLDLVLSKLGWTLVIMLPATIMGITFGIMLGAYSGWNARSKRDLALFNLMIVVRAIPTYWWAIMAVFVFGYYLAWFPLGGYTGISILYTGIDPWDVLYHAVLPIAVLTLTITAGNYYLTRNSMLSVIGEDYITTARMKGLDESAILRRYAMKNALLPMLTMASLEFASIITGSIFIETVFSWPGLGLLTTQAIRARDLPLLEAIFLLDTLLVIAANFAADMLYPVLDPRVKVGDNDE